MTGQYLRREYPLGRSTLSAAIVEKLDQVRLAERPWGGAWAPRRRDETNIRRAITGRGGTINSQLN